MTLEQTYPAVVLKMAPREPFELSFRGVSCNSMLFHAYSCTVTIAGGGVDSFSRRPYVEMRKRNRCSLDVSATPSVGKQCTHCSRPTKNG